MRSAGGLTLTGAILLGIVQEFAVLPGLSRSGLTVSALLLRRMGKVWALRLSFLMSMPIILFGNMILNYDKIRWTFHSWAGVLFAFLLGIVTTRALFRLVEKISFGYFVLAFGLLVILSVFI